MLYDKVIDLTTTYFKDTILSKGIVYLKLNNEVKCLHTANGINAITSNYFICIHYQDLLDKIKRYETYNKNINELFAVLPHCTNKNSLIAIKSDNTINYFEFPSEKDIPFYHRRAKKGFSAFCTDEEMELIKTRNKDENGICKDSFLTTSQVLNELRKMPQPKDEHCYCLLCNKRFDHYATHVQSEEHKRNSDTDAVRTINYAFTRVRLFWVGKEEKKEIVNEDNKHSNSEIMSTSTPTKKMKLNVEAYKCSYRILSKDTTAMVKRIVPVNSTNNNSSNSKDNNNDNTYLNRKRLSSRIIPIHSALN